MPQKQKPQPKAALTYDKVSQRIRKNDEREAECAARGGLLAPGGMLNLRLEEFFKVALGEAQYLVYVNNFQEVREGELATLEEALDERERQARFQLPNSDGKLLVPGK